MNDDRRDFAQPPREWLEALARGEADLAAGRTVPGEPIMKRLRQTIAEMETAKVKIASPIKATRRR
ncbi:MAG: hypothetical protein WBQ75_05455 [Acetobacteraceae bacterium]